MEIVDNKAVLVRTRHPEKFEVIPKSKVIERYEGGGALVAVHWGLDEMRVLRNIGIRKAPSPIVAKYDWPGRYQPMKHQVETASFLTLYRRAFCFNEPGTGKTLSALWAADYLMTRGEVRRVLILCPMSIMHSAWLGDISNSIIHRSAIVAHHSKASRRIEMVQGDYEFVITNYEGLNLIAHEVRSNGKFDLIIVDECFVAGTLVATPQGRRPIEQLEAGDKVLTSDGVMPIKNLVRNTATKLVEVTLGNGRSIRCTPEHPFLTDAGWVCAKNLAGRRLVSGAELSCLRAGISPQTAPGAVGHGEQPRDWAALLQILRTEEVALGEPQQERVLQLAARATGQAFGTENTGAPCEALSSGESSGAQASAAGRQRHGYVTDGARDMRGIACGLGMELPGSVGPEAARLSYELQARLRVAAPQGGVGGGRGQPHGRNAPGAGPQEGAEVGGAWVVGVSHIECPDGEAVYNLEVEGTPNYFVGDHWLVHNCNAYKNPMTQRWKSLASVVRPDTMVWMMTGTPAAQSPVDAYGLAKIVAPSNVPKFFTAWRDQVMLKVTNFKWVPKPTARDTVFDVLQPAIRFAKKDCLDLPPVMVETRDVEMTPQQAKYYNMLKTQLTVQTAGETISAVNAGVAVSKLLQISCGAAYTDASEVVEFDARPRLRVVEEVIEETARKVIIFAMFRSSMDALADYLTTKGHKVAQINGDVSASRRGQIIHTFQETDELDVLILQAQATAHGITLTAADTAIFYGPLMSVELYIQCVARVDRKGQTSESVRAVHIQSSPIERKLFAAMANRVSDHSLLVDLFGSEIKK